MRESAYFSVRDWVLCAGIAALLGFPSQQVLLSAAVMVGTLILAISAIPHLMWEIAHRALDITVITTFSTSYAALLRDFLVAVYVLIRVLERGGFLQLKKQLENARDGATAVVVTFLLTFLYHFIFSVPIQIKAAAALALPEKTFPLPSVPAWALTKEAKRMPPISLEPSTVNLPSKPNP